MSKVVGVIHTVTVETPTKKVEVATGKNATLPCTFKSNKDFQAGDITYWTKQSTEEEVINKYFDNGQTNEGLGYEGRVSFSGNINNGDISIILNKVTMDDNGIYECSVRLRSDPPRGHATVNLLVLVAPSKPDCKIVGTTEYGHTINLTCNSNEGSPQPQYSWQSYDAQHQQRQLGGTVSGGLLTLKNVSADTSGYYICLSKNNVGEEKCNITVSIMPPSMNIALYAGIIGGVVAAIIIIGVLAYCCCCRNKKGDDYEMEKENGYQPPQKEAVRIRGPAEEEIPEEEEEEEKAVAVAMIER
ncbi:cell surface A33 antigen isoform X2 [Hemicordylus capensis]|uniref:cell surface A33 antigen isoform X2 n=1 Tax=Hemicordylus capensis TaxID=884348 RepID=UPI0023021705|nr:cell surface A33 antigen isoform X2 [Hemicordylus capensis]